MRTLIHFQFTSFFLFSSLLATAATPFKPTTTLAAETQNNTSAASSFKTQSDGNIAGANISSVPVRNLMYSGATTKVYAQFLPWFGFGDHIDVGYVSTDKTQVHNQVKDMMRRGIDGAIIDWYGQGKQNQHFVSYDQASQELMLEAGAQGFTFAIQHDAVALKNCGCDVTQMLIDDLNYANRIFEGSPAYLTYNGRPVVFFFGHEAYPIDWNRVRASVAGNPMFIFENASGFNYAQSSGAFSWVIPTSPPTPGIPYLDAYYSAALGLPGTYSIGSAYKGFDDSLAAWGSNRLVPQDCGQTFLATMADADKYYSSSKQMLGIQMVTWNDYEEGTEVESGIENCVSVSASAANTVLSWGTTGQMNTVDHFSIFISQNGTDLMWLADEGVNVTSVDLARFGLPGGNYSAYVKAVAAPMMTNKMSAAVPVTLTVAPPPPSADFSLTAPSGAATTITAGQTATFALQLIASGSPLSVSISCNGSPVNSTCSGPVSSVTVNPGAPASFNINVSTDARAAMLPGIHFTAPPPAVWFVLLLATGALVAQTTRRTPRGHIGLLPRLAFVIGVVVLAMMPVGCGGSAGAGSNRTPTSGGTPAGTYTLTATATSGNLTHTEPLILTVK